jgi:hypothetical protein
MSDFITKIDYSNNRQIKQSPETTTNLSGTTVFGVPFSALTTGPNPSNSGITSSITNIVSTFSGNNTTTIFVFGNSNMNIAANSFSAITNINSGTSQNTGFVFTGISATTLDGNTYHAAYSGVSFDFLPLLIVSGAGPTFSGSGVSTKVDFLSAGTLDFTGRTIWVDVSGITRTNRLIVTNVPAGPATIDLGTDANGNVVNQVSDISLKKNIKPIDDALNKVFRLNGVYYQWKDEVAGGSDRKIGFIAQEVEKIVPELVYTHPDGLKVVHYKDITALLAEAIKELATKGVTNNVIKTETIVAEDNNIELNFKGTHESAIGGGIIINKGLSENENASILIDLDGKFVFSSGLQTNKLIVKQFTPSGSTDANGIVGQIAVDDNYFYTKTNNGWGRIKLEQF